MRQKLEFQAERIEAVLALHKIQARVTGGVVTPRWVSFQVIPAIGQKISRIKAMSEELAAALDASHCRVTRRGAAVSVEIARDDPQPVRLLPLYSQLTDQAGLGGQREIPPITAILGLAEDGAPLMIRLPSPDVAHILVAGTTGSGKTILLQTMALSMAMINPPPGKSAKRPACAFVIIDPKGHAFRSMAKLPHLTRPIVTSQEDTEEVLRSLVRLMERREQKPSTTTIVVFIDELADMLIMGGKPVQMAITRLTQRGRESGIHLVAATQKPTSAVLGPLVKANFPVRLVGRVTSADDARTASGWSGTGAERLSGRGDFIAVAEGRVTRFQVAHVSQTEIVQVVSEIAREPATISAGRPPDNGKLKSRLRDFFVSVATKVKPTHVETVFAPPAPVIVEGKAELRSQPELLLRDPAPEKQPVLPHVPPPALEPTTVEQYKQRLEQMDWDPSKSFRAACRALEVSQGGKPYKDVQNAVRQMRVVAGLDTRTGKPGMAQDRQAIQFVQPREDDEQQAVLTGPPPDQALPIVQTASAAATDEERPDDPPDDAEGPFAPGRGRTIASRLQQSDENQGDNPGEPTPPPANDVDHHKSVVIGMAAEVRWGRTPHDLALDAVRQLKDYLTLCEGEHVIVATSIVVEAIRADRRTASVALV